MNSDIEQAKAAMLKAHADRLQADEGLTFQRAWAKAQAAHPELAESRGDEGLQPTDRPAFASYRYNPGAHPAQKGHVDALRTILKDAGVWPAVQRIAARSKLDPQTAELLEARKPKEDNRQVMLVYGSNGEVSDIELV